MVEGGESEAKCIDRAGRVHIMTINKEQDKCVDLKNETIQPRKVRLHHIKKTFEATTVES